jgi:hypothetical protein
MSDTELNRFLSDLDSNEGLNRAAQALRPEGEDGIRVPAEDLVTFARQRGYEIEMDDFKPATDELDESQLEGVVGGATMQMSGLKLDTSAVTIEKWITITPYKWY